HFSVSATTRPPRAHERDGVDYHFLSAEQFEQGIAEGAFAEYEEVYPGRFYGTPHAEIARAAAAGARGLLLDLDVRGALRVRQAYPETSRAVFVAPPSPDVLAERLRARGTETAASLAARLERARLEMTYADAFDHVVVNDDLERAAEELLGFARAFLVNSAAGARSEA
ncbi:MAG: guanylate kinase, partial [Rubricoccaceae bacterium]